MRLLLGYAELGQHFEDAVRRNFKLPGQLVNADLVHKQNCNTLVTRRLTGFLRVLYSIKFFFRSRRIPSAWFR
jgi:hypothetical protein